MIGWLLSDVWQWLAGGLAAVVGALVLRWRIRREAIRDDRREAALQAAERLAKAQETGRQAEASAKADMRDGKASPDDVLRRNDGRWNR